MIQVSTIDRAAELAREMLRRTRTRLGDITVGEITEDLREDLAKAVSGDLQAAFNLSRRVGQARAAEARRQAYMAAETEHIETEQNQTIQ